MAEHQRVLMQILPHHGRQFGVELPCGHDNGQVIRITVGTGHDPHGTFNTGLKQSMCFGTDPHNASVQWGYIVVIRIDDGHLHLFSGKRRRQGTPKAAIATDDPAPLGMLVGAGQLAVSGVHQPVIDQMPVR